MRGTVRRSVQHDQQFREQYARAPARWPEFPKHYARPRDTRHGVPMSDIEKAARQRFGERLVMARMLKLALDQPAFAERFGLDVRQVRDAERAQIATPAGLLQIVEAIEVGETDLIVSNVQPSEPRGLLTNVVISGTDDLTKPDIAEPRPGAPDHGSEPHALPAKPKTIEFSVACTHARAPARCVRPVDPDADRRHLWRAHWAACRAVYAENAARHARHIAARGARPAEPDLRAPPFPDALRGLTCGARTRAGTPCKRTAIESNGRCKNHGGSSTGPRSKEGMEAARANLALRWADRARARQAP